LNLSKKGIVFHHKFIKENELFDKEFLFKKKNQFKDLSKEAFASTLTELAGQAKKTIKDLRDGLN